jgi:transcriptional regulator GlxA family with amidase domain
MEGREVVRLTRMIERRLGNVHDAAGIAATLAILHEMLNYFFSYETTNVFVNSEYTYKLYMAFFSDAADVKAEQSEFAFDKLKKYLKENLERNISVDEMANYMDLSYTHFSRIFSKAIGISPMHYLQDMRFKAAIDYLCDESLSVKEIAYLCGIRDQNYFCRLFKKKFGVSPGKYREKEI